MPSALVTTVGGTTSNSYVTVAEADTYADDRLQASSWHVGLLDKQRALLQATRRIDQESYAGWKVDEEQALSWPRSGAVDRNGFTHDNDVIPQAVKDAQVEIAILYLTANAEGSDPLASSALDAFESVSVGSISVVPRVQDRTDKISDAVRRILGPLLETSSAATVKLLRA